MYIFMYNFLAKPTKIIAQKVILFKFFFNKFIFFKNILSLKIDIFVTYKKDFILSNLI